MPPVPPLLTFSMILAETASISASVRVRVGGLQADGQRDGLLARAHLRLGLVAGELVEDPDAFDQRLVGPLGGVDGGQGLDALVDDEGEVAVDRLQVADRQRRAGGVLTLGAGTLATSTVKATAGPFTSIACSTRG
jgi:hypothetical protein